MMRISYIRMLNDRTIQGRVTDHGQYFGSTVKLTLRPKLTEDMKARIRAGWALVLDPDPIPVQPTQPVEPVFGPDGVEAFRIVPSGPKADITGRVEIYVHGHRLGIARQGAKT